MFRHDNITSLYVNFAVFAYVTHCYNGNDQYLNKPWPKHGIFFDGKKDFCKPIKDYFI